MTEFNVYHCSICGKPVIVTDNEPRNSLTCCGKNMDKLEAKTADYASEKHVPIVEKTADGIKVKVGSTVHPMTNEHYIKFIAVSDGNNIYLKELNAGDLPEAEFPVKNADVKAFEFCNIHGLWKN